MANPVSLQPSTKNKKKIYTLKTLGLVITVGAASRTLSGEKIWFSCILNGCMQYVNTLFKIER